MMTIKTNQQQLVGFLLWWWLLATPPLIAADTTATSTTSASSSSINSNDPSSRPQYLRRRRTTSMVSDVSREASSSVAYDKPVKVFILAGQSNMVGQGQTLELEELCTSSLAPPEYRQHLWDSTTNQFRVRDDVFVSYLQEDKHNPSVRYWRHGPLTANATSNFAFPGRFGVEVMMGSVLGDVLEEPVYLIKTAWGGQSLAVDFRPPSAPPAQFTGYDDPAAYGDKYRQMWTDVREALDNIHQVIPQYNPQVGYELAGLVWFQGFNDILNAEFRAEYGRNLELLLGDIRAQTYQPRLPIVVGELGMHGPEPTRFADRINQFRQAQLAATELPVNQKNTLLVHTAALAPPQNYTDNPLTEAHYFEAASAFFHIGQAFGQGMLELLQRQQEQ